MLNLNKFQKNFVDHMTTEVMNEIETYLSTHPIKNNNAKKGKGSRTLAQDLFIIKEFFQRYLDCENRVDSKKIKNEVAEAIGYKQPLCIFNKFLYEICKKMKPTDLVECIRKNENVYPNQFIKNKESKEEKPKKKSQSRDRSKRKNTKKQGTRKKSKTV